MDTDTTTSAEVKVDFTPVTQRLDNLNDLVVFQSIIIFAILVFLGFEIALRGFYKIGK